MKAISTIIATILLLLITVSLAGSAYVFLGGALTGKTSKMISLLDAQCNGTAITIVISNDGTDTVKSNELKILINNKAVGNFGQDLNPRESKVNITTNGTGSANILVKGSNVLMVASPSNSIRTNIYC
jgi:flagellin-like protein